LFFCILFSFSGCGISKKNGNKETSFNFADEVYTTDDYAIEYQVPKGYNYDEKNIFLKMMMDLHLRLFPIVVIRINLPV